MYIRLYNKFKPDQTMLVQELSDFLFEEGWRILEHIGNKVTADDIDTARECQRQTAIRQYGF
jgi:hypothetical protein